MNGRLVFALLGVFLALLGVLNVSCASTASDAEPPSSRSVPLVGLEPAPIMQIPPPAERSDGAAPPVAPTRSSAGGTVATTPATRPVAPLTAGDEPRHGSCKARVGAFGISRSALIRTLDAGLGAWLRGVDIEGKVEHGHFQGWVVKQIYSGDPCWMNVDVRAGDVVTRINHRPIERPEEAQAVWTALRNSSEIQVELLRGGRLRTLRFTIIDITDDAPSSGAAPRSPLAAAPAVRAG